MKYDQEVSLTQISFDVTFNLVLFYLLILAGFLLSRITPYGKKVQNYLNPLLINFMLPLLIISTLFDVAFDTLTESPQVIAITALMHLVGALLLFLYLKTKNFKPENDGALLLCATFHNAVFLPLPLSQMFIGQAAVPLIAVHSLTQMILLTTLGALIGSYYNQESIDRKSVARKALLFPPLLATIVGFVLSVLGISVPSSLHMVISVNNTATTYLSLLAVGLALGKEFSLYHSRQALSVIGVRQIAIPLLVWFVLGFTDLAPLTNDVLFLESLMPSAVLTVVYASEFGLDSQVAATSVTIGTIVLLPLLPLLPFLLSFV
jgi:hypothetical protein